VAHVPHCLILQTSGPLIGQNEGFWPWQRFALTKCFRSSHTFLQCCEWLSGRMASL